MVTSRLEATEASKSSSWSEQGRFAKNLSALLEPVRRCAV